MDSNAEILLLKSRLAEMEDRNLCSDICLVGLPEGMERDGWFEEI